MEVQLHGVPVYVTDQAQAMAFYRDKLGFDVTMDTELEDGYRYVSVAPHGTETNLILSTTSAEEFGEETSMGKHTGIVFMTDNIHTTYEEWRARGVHFVQTPQKEEGGTVEAQFVDPDQNRFDLVQKPKYS